MNGPIFFDLTTSFHFTGNPTGIARVEQCAFEAMQRHIPSLVPVAWNSKTGAYLALDYPIVISGEQRDDLNALESDGRAFPIHPRNMDDTATLVIFGGAWIRNERYVEAIASLKIETGSKIVLLVHDLIQAKLSYLYPPGTADVFVQNAKRMFELTDLFLCYSQTSKSDVLAFADECGLETPIETFPIGDMTDAIKLERRGKRPAIADKFRTNRFVLFVSSIDARKNHALLVNVWRRFAENQGFKALPLVIVGRPSWKGEEIIASITDDRSLNGRIHILQDVSDSDLDWLYRNCLFTVYPSLYEGWGLPVEESLSYGKLCITSDRTATAEVSPGLTELCDPYDFRQWMETIQFYTNNGTALAAREAQIREEYKAIPWATSIEAVLSSIRSSNYRAPVPIMSVKKRSQMMPAAISDELRSSLLVALSETRPVDIAAGQGRIARTLRLLHLAGLASKVYNRLFSRSNDALRRTIEYLIAIDGGPKPDRQEQPKPIPKPARPLASSVLLPDPQDFLDTMA